MKWVFYALFGAAILHILEEYVYPGGFTDFIKKMAPALGHTISTTFSVTINALFLSLCLAAALIGSQMPVFSLSVASLCGVNSVIHVVGAVRSKHYSPGMVTGLTLYAPLSVAAYYFVWRSGALTWKDGVVSILLGVVLNAVPASILTTMSALTRHG